MPEYRWNQSEMAAGYDAGAVLVHPHYVEVQDVILQRLPFETKWTGLLIDLGGGSGRLVERILDRWPGATALIIDQSQAFLDLARQRLQRFSDRMMLVCRRLQENWRDVVGQPAAAIVSMSAIHHLDPAEKRQCYQQCFDVLQPGGVLLNGDEVRTASDQDYREQVEDWAVHMQRLIADEAVTPSMAEGLRKWQQRNVAQFADPKVSGDDCHETAAVQLDYLERCGFTNVQTTWSKDLWSILSGQKPL